MSDVEKAIGTVLVVLIASFGTGFLFKLQSYMKEVRKKLDPGDRDPWVRGSDVLLVLASIIVLSAILVFYFLWVPHHTG